MPELSGEGQLAAGVLHPGAGAGGGEKCGSGVEDLDRGDDVDNVDDVDDVDDVDNVDDADNVDHVSDGLNGLNGLNGLTHELDACEGVGAEDDEAGGEESLEEHGDALEGVTLYGAGDGGGVNLGHEPYEA